MAYNKLSLSEKLLTKTNPVGDCLVWTGQKNKKGYGQLRIDGRLQRAHRLMYELHHGEIQPGAVVMHSCDNPACVAIAHLSAASQQANIIDMYSKGRGASLRHEDHPKAKLTKAQVAEIRRRFKIYCRINGARPLGREFGVSKTAIGAIIRGETWRN